MSLGWKTTREDVENVVNQECSMSKFESDEEYDCFIDECLEVLDDNRTNKDAKMGDDMSEQIDYAYESIREQLTEADKI